MLTTVPPPSRGFSHLSCCCQKFERASRSKPVLHFRLAVYREVALLQGTLLRTPVLEGALPDSPAQIPEPLRAPDLRPLHLHHADPLLFVKICTVPQVGNSQHSVNVFLNTRPQAMRCRSPRSRPTDNTPVYRGGAAGALSKQHALKERNTMVF